MSEPSWETVDTVAGEFKAEILRGLLEAQGIPVLLSQEGIGHSVYPVTVGKLGEVDILVPTPYKEQAKAVLQEYYTGSFEVHEDDEKATPDEGGTGA